MQIDNTLILKILKSLYNYNSQYKMIKSHSILFTDFDSLLRTPISILWKEQK